MLVAVRAPAGAAEVAIPLQVVERSEELAQDRTQVAIQRLELLNDPIERARLGGLVRVQIADEQLASKT